MLILILSFQGPAVTIKEEKEPEPEGTHLQNLSSDDIDMSFLDTFGEFQAMILLLVMAVY